MKSIQKFIVLSLMVLFATSTLSAQNGKKRDRNIEPTSFAKKKTERMAEQLNLSEAQIAKVSEINSTYAEKMKALKAASTDKTAMKTQMKSLRTEHDTAIKTVLNADQAAKMDAKKDEIRSKKGKGHKGKKGHNGKAKTPQERAQHHTEKMTKSLGLSPEQSQGVESIYLKYAEKRAAMKGTSKEDKDAAKKKWKSLKKEQTKEIKALLTPEQITKLDALKGKKGKKGKKKDSRKRI